jgi:acetoin utilization deacetylase AcuC-like enzyme
MDRVQFYSHPDCSLHDTGWGHSEHQGRLRAIAQAVAAAMPDLHDKIRPVDAQSLDPVDALLVHTERHVNLVRETVEAAAESGELRQLDVDTVVSGRSWEAALAGAGCAVAATEAVLSGRARTAFAAVRPPGHHAESDRPMGFCLLNNVAIAAAVARQRGLADRVLIVDWDVHHGNGTQEVFYADPNVYYVSLHQSPHYPGTGASTERGVGLGEGTTRNFPMSPGLEASIYVDTLVEGVAEIALDFRPDLLLISAGFDAGIDDPLGGFTLETADFARMTRDLVNATRTSTGGRTVSLLEGGYNPSEMGRNVVAHLQALAASVDD